MKYDAQTTLELQQKYVQGSSDPDIINKLAAEYDVPTRSIIAKLSSLGVYKKKEYLNKRGEPPVKKEEYIERIAKAMEVNLELLESLEKANKNVLILILQALE